jgi:hypothetical protein
MTARTPTETVEAVAEFLENGKAMLPDNLSGADGYAWAIYKIRAVALAFRLSQPPKRGRRPNASKGGE